MNQLIDIEWNIEAHERDNYYIRIDCFKNEKGKLVKYDCCLKSQEGCNIGVCGGGPDDIWKIRLYDKHDTLIDEQEYNDAISTIVISRNANGILTIEIRP